MAIIERMRCGMGSDKKAKKLSRADHIQEEAKRAAEFGRRPTQPVSISPNFRVARSTPSQFSTGSTIVPSYEVAMRNDRDFKIGLTTSVVASLVSAIPSVGCLDPKALREAMKVDLENLGSRSLEQLLPRIVDQLKALSGQVRDNKLIGDIEKQISEAVFGYVKFKDNKGKKGGAEC